MNGATDNKGAGLKEKLLHEMKEMLAIFLYLALFFCAFALYRQLIMRELGINFVQYAFALIKALVWATRSFCSTPDALHHTRSNVPVARHLQQQRRASSSANCSVPLVHAPLVHTLHAFFDARDATHQLHRSLCCAAAVRLAIGAARCYSPE